MYCGVWSVGALWCVECWCTVVCGVLGEWNTTSVGVVCGVLVHCGVWSVGALWCVECWVSGIPLVLVWCVECWCTVGVVCGVLVHCGVWSVNTTSVGVVCGVCI